MHRWLSAAATVAVLFVLPATAGAQARSGTPLDAYQAKVDAAQLERLKAAGIDVADATPRGNAFDVDLVLDAAQRVKAESLGVKPKLTRVKGGQTVREFAAAQAESGYQVWRSRSRARTRRSPRWSSSGRPIRGANCSPSSSRRARAARPTAAARP